MCISPLRGFRDWNNDQARGFTPRFCISPLRGFRDGNNDQARGFTPRLCISPLRGFRDGMTIKNEFFCVTLCPLCLYGKENSPYSCDQNFLTAIFHKQVCFSSRKFYVLFRKVSSYSKILKNIFDSNDLHKYFINKRFALEKNFTAVSSPQTPNYYYMQIKHLLK